MNLNYEKIKKIDFKKWLLGGNSKLYAVILIVFIVAVVFVFSAIKSMSNDTKSSDNNDISVEQGTTEAESVTKATLENLTYRLSINKANNYIDVLVVNDSNEVVRNEYSFRCSINPEVEKGSFKLVSKSIWVRFDYGVHGHYTSKLSNGMYIHSVPYFTKDIYNLNIQAYNNLGNPAQVGYIYLAAADAKWIFENCSINTELEIYEDASRQPVCTIDEFIPITNGERKDPTDNSVTAQTQATRESDAETSQQIETEKSEETTQEMEIIQTEYESESDAETVTQPFTEKNTESETQSVIETITETETSKEA